MDDLMNFKMPWLAVAGLLIGSYFAFLLIEDYIQMKRYRFPNLVPGLPLLGNMVQMPATDHGPYLQKLSEKYGEM
jgi:hypothetical protein